MTDYLSGAPTEDRPNPNLAVADLTGLKYTQVLANLHTTLRPRSYLEIGCFTGESVKLAACDTLIIDPDLSRLVNVMKGKASLLAFQMTSDAFFRRPDALTVLGKPVDLAFLDGMHLFEYLLRDFINVERMCLPDSVIVMHDCVPTDADVGDRVDDFNKRSLHPNWWAGDVWKIIPILRKFRPDLIISVIDSAPTGLVIVTNLHPLSNTLRLNQQEIVDKWRDVSLRDYGLLRFLRESQLISVDEFTRHTLPSLVRLGT